MTGTMRTILLLLLCTLALSLGASAQSITMTPASQSVGIGEQATFLIDVSDVVSLHSWEIRVNFDSSSLSFVSLDEGTFLNEDGGFMTTCLGPANMTVPGAQTHQFMYSCLREPVPPFSGVNGSGTLAVLTLEGDNPGTSAVTLSGTTLSDSLIQQITHTTSDAAITVNAAPDLTPPVMALVAPANESTLPWDTAQVTLQISTDENARCQYGSSDFSYGDGTDFSITGTTAHSQLVSGLTAGSSYTYYYRCNDSAGNANTASLHHSFSTGPAPAYTLTIQTVGSGSVSANRSLAGIPTGTHVELSAVPGAGWIFMNWTGDATGTATPVTLVVDSGKTVTATFADITPPGVVSNLSSTGAGYTWIGWQWTNPADADFAYAEVWIDGASAVNTTEESHLENGLPLNSAHTIALYAVDTQGNRNPAAVQSTDSTLAYALATAITAPIDGQSYAYSYAVPLALTAENASNCSWRIDGGSWTGFSQADALAFSSTLPVLTNGPHTIEASCTDSYGYPDAQSATFGVNDTSAPAVSVSVANTQVYLMFTYTGDEPFNASFALGPAGNFTAFTENASFLLTQSYANDTLAPSTLYSYRLDYCDSNGNCGTIEGNASTASPPPDDDDDDGGSSGGSSRRRSSSGISIDTSGEESKSHWYTGVEAGDRIVWDVADEDIPVITVSLTAQEPAETAALSINTYTRKPSGVPAYTATRPFVWFTLGGEGFSDVSGLAITFIVDGSWFAGAGTDPAEVMLLALDGDAWSEVDITRRGVLDGDPRFDAGLDGFGRFIITAPDAGEEAEEGIVPISTVPAAKPAATPVAGTQDMLLDGEDTASGEGFGISGATVTEDSSGWDPTTITLVGALFIILVAAVVGARYMTRKGGEG
ncbi:hypothetical protein JXB02_01225 [Candidatus Woesearchaeota archaeon]|nr:hypothetical protein [Candidatus Woesearchaeota archaeon]